MLKRSRFLVLCLLLSPGVLCAQTGDGARRPGKESRDVTLLPNGWRISPAGRHLTVGDLPLAMVQSADGRHVVVSSNGWSKPTLTVLDPKNSYVRSRLTVDHAWLGLAWGPGGRKLYSSGAADSSVREFDFAGGQLRPERTFVLSRPSSESFVGGLSITPDGSRLFAVHVLGELLSAVDLQSGRVVASRPLAAEGYTSVVSADGKTVYVSLWGGAKVLAFDAATVAPKAEIAVGEHPNAMVLSKDGSRLFVACANTNAVWVVDLKTNAATEQIGISLHPGAPPGSTPNALALSADGETLLVANADNNNVALVDVATPGKSQVKGFVPTGWYPTAVQFSQDGKQIYVLAGKGLTGMPNPRGPQPGIQGPNITEGQYAGAMLQGAFSIVPLPDAKALAAHTEKVYRLSPYTDATKLAPAGAPARSPIPRKVGEPSPIKYVFYVIRENRTYDQILGDMEKGNGDPNLCLFGEEVTPNAHALAREFVLLDNFYVDAEVSYDGHAFSTGAYATDFVEKVWPMNYGQRGGRYLSEGGGAMRNPYGNVTAPQNGYIWDACVRKGVSVRSYGEFTGRGQDDVDHQVGEGTVKAMVPGLEGRIHPTYPPYDLRIPDNKRVDVWLEEFQKFEMEGGGLPQLSIVRLGNDHTAGTRPGYPTPRAMIAENDLALGRFVEAITRSRYWKESAIFVLEDDAQNGPDHVDSHRSVALVISPYTRRGAVDSTLYTTSGMLRTIELILGLPPMSQYDAAATPMYNAFQVQPVLMPYARREARVSFEEKNTADSWGAAASVAMNLEEADMAPELPLNEILWKAVRGADSPMPPPVRAAFLRPIPEDDEDEEEKEEREKRERSSKAGRRP
jgi:DNA-binding beta-propeller fold protein YncE